MQRTKSAIFTSPKWVKRTSRPSKATPSRAALEQPTVGFRNLNLDESGVDEGGLREKSPSEREFAQFLQQGMHDFGGWGNWGGPSLSPFSAAEARQYVPKYVPGDGLSGSLAALLSR